MKPRFDAFVVGMFLALAISAPSDAARSLQDYRYFRSLSIDMQGRVPTRTELTDFERTDFDVDNWVESKLSTSGYEDRIRRIYLDPLRPALSTIFPFVTSVVLRRHSIQVEGGTTANVYWRNGQRRKRDSTDGIFCLGEADTGLKFPRTGNPTGTAKPVTKAILDQYTVKVKPWWLYRDYASSAPKDLYSATTWATKYPNFAPHPALLTEADGSATTEIRVCKEEAQTAESGTIYKSGRTTTTTPADRIVPLAGDTNFAITNVGKPIYCASDTAVTNSADCGCGVGLERCSPGANNGFDPSGFVLPTKAPLGVTLPVDVGSTAQSEWTRFWWSQEVYEFIARLAREDRDFREILTSPSTVINGPLAQFYKSYQGSTCCGQGASFGYSEPQSLFDRANVPTDLLPHDTTTWKVVSDRGPNAAGILTMPIFLAKYGSRRARAHAIYGTFLCRQFVAESVELTPSTEPDLTKRPGCSTCHATLEPMSAYFARVRESDWTFLPKENFPVLETKRCNRSTPASDCRSYYDPAFTSDAGAMLLGAYASQTNADLGPRGFAEATVADPAFAECIVSTVASSFLGRIMVTDDATRLSTWKTALTSGGFRMRALIREILKSDAYRNANNLNSTLWRKEEGP